MTQRPQEQITAPGVKAVAFLGALLLGTVVALCLAEERRVQVVVATKNLAAFAPVPAETLGLKEAKGDGASVAMTTNEVVGHVLLADVSTGEAVPKSSVVRSPVCPQSAPTTFGTVVLPLQSPLPSTLKKGAVAQLRASSEGTEVAFRAVFLNTIDPPKAVPPEAVAVSYAEFLVAVVDAAALGPPTTWAVLPAPPCPASP